MYTPPTGDFQDGQPFGEGIAIVDEKRGSSISVYRRAIYIATSVLIILALLFSMIGPLLFRYIQPSEEREGEMQAGRILESQILNRELNPDDGGIGFL